MIQQQTVLKVSDNSGAQNSKCISLLKGFKKKKAMLGDIVIVSIKKLKIKSRLISKVKKGEICKAIIIKTKIPIFKKDGSFIKFFNNSVCLINKQKNVIGTRIFGLLPKELKKKKSFKTTNISVDYI